MSHKNKQQTSKHTTKTKIIMSEEEQQHKGMLAKTGDALKAAAHKTGEVAKVRMFANVAHVIAGKAASPL